MASAILILGAGKRKGVQKHGDYRTKLVIFDIYDRMQHANATGKPYQTLLDPPPADPRVAHSANNNEGTTRPAWASANVSS